MATDKKEEKFVPFVVLENDTDRLVAVSKMTVDCDSLHSSHAVIRLGDSAYDVIPEKAFIDSIGVKSWFRSNMNEVMWSLLRSACVDAVSSKKKLQSSKNV